MLGVEKEKSLSFTDYSEHPNNVNFVVARLPAPFVHIGSTDYSESLPATC
jgi:hypothetical protein